MSDQELNEGNTSPSRPVLLDTETWNAASQAAQYHASRWIRAALREVALQALRKSFPDAAKAPNDDDKNTLSRNITITANAIEDAKKLSLLVAKQWSEQLRNLQHHEAAEWVDHIAATECAILFNEKQSSAAQSIVVNNDASDSNPTEIQKDDNHVTAQARLRRLGKPEIVGGVPPPLQSNLDKLNHWGRTGSTDWPYEWGLIEQAARQIPERLYKGRPEVQLQIVPKALWEHQQQQRQQRQGQQDVANDQAEASAAATADTIQLDTQQQRQVILDRKRKSSQRNRLPPTKRQLSTLSDQATTAIVPKPRPPSNDTGRFQWTMDEIHRNLSASEKRTLDRYVHDYSHNDPPLSIMLLGPLVDFGRVHAYHQRQVDPTIDTASFTPKQRKRQQGYYVKERLGPRVIVNADLAAGRKLPRSRVVVTGSAPTKHHHQQKPTYGLDLDLGCSMLEWRAMPQPAPNSTSIQPSRKLLLFSSVEVMLQEDEKFGLQEEASGECQELL